jgi:NAD(P)-dependent dehydrogenase (short-subunit alcohol dehydrogenase family)
VRPGRDHIFDRFQLDGKAAIVTGVGPGIGAHVAKAFADVGANVVLAARDAQRIGALADQIKADGGSALAVPCDVGVEADLDRLVEAARDAFGMVDILFNNAAATAIDRMGVFEHRTSDWMDCLNVNLLAPYRLSQKLVPAMKAKGKGSIINVLSTAGFTVLDPLVAYGCTKAGLAMLTRYLAKECAPEVRVNSICAGTTLPVGVPAEEATGPWAGTIAHVPMKRVGGADEYVGVALLLASEAATYTTGQCIFVDGGRVNTIGGQSYDTPDGTRPAAKGASSG